MTEVPRERRLSERLKKALDDIEGRGSHYELAEKLRQTYTMALEDEARYRPNRRAAYRTRNSDTE